MNNEKKLKTLMMNKKSLTANKKDLIKNKQNLMLTKHKLIVSGQNLNVNMMLEKFLTKNMNVGNKNSMHVRLNMMDCKHSMMLNKLIMICGKTC